MIKKWETLEENFIGDFIVFKLYKKRSRNPMTTQEGDFTSLQTNDWVNVIPITKENEIVLVRQYRHGIDEVTLEIPAGAMEYGEEPSEAAKRECVEETGYVGEDEIVYLGKTRPNAAFLNNWCHHFLWEGCELKHEQLLDKNEYIEFLKIPLFEIDNLINNGEINQALNISAFYYWAKQRK